MNYIGLHGGPSASISGYQALKMGHIIKNEALVHIFIWAKLSRINLTRAFDPKDNLPVSR